MKTEAQLQAVKPWMRFPRVTANVPLEEMLIEVNSVLLNIPTTSLTETNELIYATATVVLEMLRYKIKIKNIECPPRRRRLVAKGTLEGHQTAHVSAKGSHEKQVLSDEVVQQKNTVHK